MAAAAMSAATSYFFGTRLTTNNLASYSDKFHALLKFSTKKKATLPPPPPKRVSSNNKLSGERLVWLPGAEPTEWLDRTMVKECGLDPFGFAKPAKYLQFDLDSLDQNLAKNVAGKVIETRVEATKVKPTPLQLYTEVFRL